VAAAAFLFIRGFGPRSGSPPFSPFSTIDSSLTVTGLDLAPDLIHDLLNAYAEDYPRLTIHLKGGGTTQGLEALANKRAQVAFLSRPPTRAEQDLFRSAGKDTALWFPVAVGGMVLVRNAASPVESLSLDAIQGLVRGAGDPRVGHFYVPDPNLGLWDALRERLHATGNAGERPSGVVFLESEAAVLDAVRADPSSLGLASSLTLPKTLPGLATVALVSVTGGAEQPTDDAIAYSRYPLHHYLYVASTPYGDIQGSMFVTYLTSDRGQRRLERAGWLPARQVLREIYLTTHPLGGRS
jgi:phosphate transport system substrate-binding protein